MKLHINNIPQALSFSNVKSTHYARLGMNEQFHEVMDLTGIPPLLWSTFNGEIDYRERPGQSPMEKVIAQYKHHLRHAIQAINTHVEQQVCDSFILSMSSRRFTTNGQSEAFGRLLIDQLILTMLMVLESSGSKWVPFVVPEYRISQTEKLALIINNPYVTVLTGTVDYAVFFMPSRRLIHEVARITNIKHRDDRKHKGPSY